VVLSDGAYDKATGKEMGAVYMPAPQTGSLMTYMLDGGQYLVVATGRGSYIAGLLAFRLPQARGKNAKCNSLLRHVDRPPGPFSAGNAISFSRFRIRSPRVNAGET
jgi:hypothetical protein